jgi:ribosomal protein S18 acetylase RimI-like enzyme
MLVDAASRVIASDVAAFALVVDAKDAQAVAFYEHHGFSRLDVEGAGRTLFIPLKGMAAGLKQE